MFRVLSKLGLILAMVAAAAACSPRVERAGSTGRWAGRAPASGSGAASNGVATVCNLAGWAKISATQRARLLEPPTDQEIDAAIRFQIRKPDLWARDAILLLLQYEHLSAREMAALWQRIAHRVAANGFMFINVSHRGSNGAYVYQGIAGHMLVIRSDGAVLRATKPIHEKGEVWPEDYTGFTHINPDGGEDRRKAFAALAAKAEREPPTHTKLDEILGFAAKEMPDATEAGKNAVRYLASRDEVLDPAEKLELWRKLVRALRRRFPGFRSEERRAADGMVIFQGPGTNVTLLIRPDGRMAKSYKMPMVKEDEAFAIDESLFGPLQPADRP